MAQYCIYLRKSRADAEAEAQGQGETLARHEQTLVELAARLHLSVEAIHREIVSGETIAARPVMQQLLAEVEQGVWDGVLVMEVERLARGDTVDQGIVAQTFKYSGTKIITPMKTYDPSNEFDEEYFEFGLFMSRREYKTINRRLQQGRTASVREGKFIHHTAPYGYRRVKLENQKGFTLTIIPDEAEIVRDMFRWFVGEGCERIGVSLIARRLNEAGVKPRKSDAWTPPTVRDMLSNPVYAGKIRANWRPSKKRMQGGVVTYTRERRGREDWDLYEGLHEAIISWDTWLRAQDTFQRRPGSRPPLGTVKSPLAGLVVCGICGRKMVRRPYSNGYPDTLMCPSTACPNVSSWLELVEQAVLDALRDWVDRYKVEASAARQSTAKTEIHAVRRQLDMLQKEAATIEKQIGSLYDLVEQGAYTPAMFVERSQVLQQKRQDCADAIAAANSKIAALEQQESARISLVPRVVSALETYNDTLSPADRNKLLSEVIDKVIYKKEKGGRWGDPRDFSLDVSPKLPPNTKL